MQCIWPCQNSKALRLLFLNLESKEVLMITHGLWDFNKKPATNHSQYTLFLTKFCIMKLHKFLCLILLSLFVTKWIFYDIQKETIKEQNPVWKWIEEKIVEASKWCWQFDDYLSLCGTSVSLCINTTMIQTFVFWKK